MIEWMYQDRSAFNKTEQTAEEYLLGKEVKEGDLMANNKSETARDKFAKGLNPYKGDKELQESYTTNENEAFLRLKEDPLMMIRICALMRRRTAHLHRRLANRGRRVAHTLHHCALDARVAVQKKIERTERIDK